MRNKQYKTSFETTVDYSIILRAVFQASLDQTLLDVNEELNHTLTLVEDHKVASGNLKIDLAALQVGIL